MHPDCLLVFYPYVLFFLRALRVLRGSFSLWYIKIHKFLKKLQNQKAGGTFTLLSINKELLEYENSSKNRNQEDIL
jgi:hypothetical protein